MHKKSKLIRSDTGGRRWQVGDHEKESYWRRHFDAHRSSGLSTRAYCAQNGVAYSSFMGWRKRLEELDGKAAVPAKVVSHVKASEKAGNPFVPIRLLSEKVSSQESMHPPVKTPVEHNRLEIALPSGAVIRMHDGCRVDFIANLLSALRS